MLSAIILVAACAIFYWSSGVFSYINMLLMVCASAAVAWGLVDAFRPRQGALHYAAGEWVLAQGEVESQGTLQVVLDLQQYLLVRFIPSEYSLETVAQQKIKSQWLHLESRYTQRHGQQQDALPGQDWRALRRAVHALAESATASGQSALLGVPANHV
jgi:HPt (histidine-containing phosphotransfer) domain-containing protein